MKNKGFSLLALVMVIGLVLAIVGCSAPEATTPTGTGSTSTGAAKTLKIGVLASLTGPSAQWGLAVNRSTELAADDINNKGGLKVGNDTYMIKVIAADHKMQGTEAVAGANKLIYQDGVKYINCLGSAPILAAQAVTEPNKVIMMISGFAAGIITPEKPFTFRATYDAQCSSDGLYGYIAENMKDVKTVAAIANDDDTGKASANKATEVAASKGLKVLSKNFVPRGTTDFYPVLTKMLADKPDIIDVDSIAPADVALMIKQAREKGYTGGFVCNNENDIPLIVKVASPDAANGYMQVGLDYTGDVATAEQKQLYANYMKKYNNADFDPLVGSIYTFTIAHSVGIEAAQSIDTEKVAKIIPSTPFKALGLDYTWGGLQRYGIQHSVVGPVFVSMIKGGKQVSLGMNTPDIP